MTATTFAATIDDAARFGAAKQVRDYLGLVPREYSSGERQRKGRISKAGGSFAPPSGNPRPSGIVYDRPQVLPMTNDANGFAPAVGGQWMNYTVNVTASQAYTFSARVASPYSGSTFHVEVDSVDRTGPIAILYTGSGDTYQFVSVDNIWLDAGAHLMTVVVDSYGQNAGNFDYFALNPYYQPPACNPTSSQLSACQRRGGVWDYDGVLRVRPSPQGLHRAATVDGRCSPGAGGPKHSGAEVSFTHYSASRPRRGGNAPRRYSRIEISSLRAAAALRSPAES